MKPRIALAQPHVDPGKSLGINKAPTGIQYIAAQLEAAGYEVMMFHNYADRINAALLQFQPDHVGISSMSNNFPEAISIAEFVKNNLGQQITVTLGGWHASGCAVEYQKWQNSNGKDGEKETLEEILHKGSPFDFIVVGEGESAYRHLIERVASKSPIERLLETEGIGLIDAQGNIFLNSRQSVPDLNHLNYPSWAGLDAGQYRDLRTGSLDISVHFNRGCRFRCDFCETPGIYGPGVRSTDARKAADYIEFLLQRFKPLVITFTDEDFFANPQWANAMVDEMQKREFHQKYGVNFDTFATVLDLHNFQRREQGNLLDRMREAGFSSFTIGVETLNGTTIELYNKAKIMVAPMMTDGEKAGYRGPELNSEQRTKLLENVYFREVQRAINFAQQHGILIIGDYIIGHPSESESEVKRGFEKFSSLQNLFFAYVPIYTPFPGTGLWKREYDSGRILRNSGGSIDWSRFDASAGAMRLDYDGQQLRDELEQRFYTSKRHQRDMATELQRNSGRLNMFRDRFTYLNHLYPANTEISRVLGELRSVR